MIEAAKESATKSDDEVVAKEVSESRLDLITGNWTIFAPERGQRPEELRVGHTVSASVDCPFCSGRESETPPAVWVGHVEPDRAQKSAACTNRQSEDPSWSVRVVPNRFPAVGPPPTCDEVGCASPRDAVFQSRPLYGGHEVIIESPNHIRSLTDLDLPEVSLVFRAYQDRIRYWRENAGVRYISVFKNVGAEAGASLCHGHSQLLAIDRMPRDVRNVVERMQHHRARTGCCLQCDLVRAELKSKRRIVAQTESLVAFCPFASSLPMSLRVTTKSHQACFEKLSPSQIDSVSRLTVRATSWLESLCPGTSYNYLLHTQPPAIADDSESFHWSLEIFPRLNQVAGFEWSSGCMINPVLPETAASRYRACAAAENPRLVL